MGFRLSMRFTRPLQTVQAPAAATASRSPDGPQGTITFNAVFPVAFGIRFGHIGAACGLGRASGCSSGVEHNLAKVGVERSNRFTRSSFLIGSKHQKGLPSGSPFVFSICCRCQAGLPMHTFDVASGNLAALYPACARRRYHENRSHGWPASSGVFHPGVANHGTGGCLGRRLTAREGSTENS